MVQGKKNTENYALKALHVAVKQQSQDNKPLDMSCYSCSTTHDHASNDNLYYYVYIYKSKDLLPLSFFLSTCFS